MQHVLSLQKFTSPKFSTIFIFMINLHHSITSLCETNWDTIFNLSPRALGLAEHYDDLEDLTTEKPDVNERLRKEAIWKASNAYYKHWCMIQWHRHEIYQKIYSTGFSGRKFYTLKVHALGLFLFTIQQYKCINIRNLGPFLFNYTEYVKIQKIMQEKMLFSWKIYTAGTNFTH